MTAEEVREKRRAERKQFKLDRARAIAEASMEAEKAFASSGVVLKESSVMIPSSSTWKPVQHEGSSASPSRTLIGPRGSRSADSDPLEETRGGVESVIMDEEPADFEHLQLTLQEAFFLVWTMDCLSILDASTVCVSATCVMNLRSPLSGFRETQYVCIGYGISFKPYTILSSTSPRP